MSDLAALDDYGVLTDAETLTLQRVLPGSVERVWDYLTKSDLRAKWLASGDMDLRAGGAFKLTWHNDTLTSPPGERPEGFGAEHTMQGNILAVDPPRKLVITWGEKGEVSFELEASGGKVLLTLNHKRAPDRAQLLNVSAGWHNHLDIMAARLDGREPAPFWDHWQALREDYEARFPA